MATCAVLGIRVDHCVFLSDKRNQERWKSDIFHSVISLRDSHRFVGE